MDEPEGPYAKWNKPEKDQYCVISIICEVLKLNSEKQ